MQYSQHYISMYIAIYLVIASLIILASASYKKCAVSARQVFITINNTLYISVVLENERFKTGCPCCSLFPYDCMLCQI